ncbi:Flp pilus assembly protein CpaB [Salibacterium salarium]|uniref:Flp pilus assembly protein CpaB n=1 Tax=Salibacterium salarium TaxID=284579 RepID=UPI00278382A8|nr:Flp pilus assembly protein CpaB [Salibacterium salarium]MDQ0298875.1 Flp pilus assembly protein CpaB [Salibacterium salarium]
MLGKISLRLILILGSAAGIAFLTYQYLQSLQETETLVVADTTIEEHSVIEEDMISTVEVEANAAKTLVQNSIEDPEVVKGAIAKTEISSGEPLELDPDLLVYPEDREEYLTQDGSIDSSEFIPAEKRLFTVALEPDDAVNNTLQSGDLVDVIVTLDSEETGERFSRMLSQAIKIHDVETVDGSGESYGKDGLIQHITLVVSPQEAIALSTAKEEGVVTLSLNPSDGGEKVEVERIYESSLEN